MQDATDQPENAGDAREDASRARRPVRAASPGEASRDRPTGKQQPHSPARGRGRSAEAGRKSSGLRQTLIPILLTLGVLLPALALMWIREEPDSPWRDIGWWLPVTLGLVGALCLALGAANMLAIRNASKSAN